MRKHDETMNKQEAIQQQVDEIMDSFNFAKVRNVMDLTDWRWLSCDGVPDECDLRAQARKLLKDAARMNSTVMTGGFCARCINGEDFLRLELSFRVDYSINDGISYSND